MTTTKRASYPSEAAAFDDGYRDARHKREYKPKWKAGYLVARYKEGFLMGGGVLYHAN